MCLSLVQPGPRVGVTRITRRVRDTVVSRAHRHAPAAVRRWWEDCAVAARVSRSPDRAVLQDVIFPRVRALLAADGEADILWIGCARFTRTYYRVLEGAGARCWTLDIDPAVARWGRRGRHVIGDVAMLARLFPGWRFHAIFCNGVFGYGIDTVAAQGAAIEAMARATVPGGWLLLGWNTHKVADPRESGILTSWYESAELADFGARQVVPGCTHVYDVLRLRNGETAPAASDCPR